MTSRVIVIMALAVGVLLATGCATPAQLSPQVATTLVDLRHELANGKAQVERTSESLRDLAKNPRLNTQRQIEFFHKEMTALEATGQRIRDINTQVQAHADEHYTAWNKELSQTKNPEIAQASQAREQRTRQTLDAIRSKLDAGKQLWSPFLSDLRDIDRYLQRDQTAEAVAAIAPVIQKTLNAKDAAIKKVDEVIAEIDAATKSVQ